MTAAQKQAGPPDQFGLRATLQRTPTPGPSARTWAWLAVVTAINTASTTRTRPTRITSFPNAETLLLSRAIGLAQVKTSWCPLPLAPRRGGRGYDVEARATRPWWRWA